MHKYRVDQLIQPRYEILIYFKIKLWPNILSLQPSENSKHKFHQVSKLKFCIYSWPSLRVSKATREVM
jgi:hypothetical protein